MDYQPPPERSPPGGSGPTPTLDEFRTMLDKIDRERDRAANKMDEQLYSIITAYRSADQVFVDRHSACLQDLLMAYPLAATTCPWARPCANVPHQGSFFHGGLVIQFHPSGSELGANMIGDTSTPPSPNATPEVAQSQPSSVFDSAIPPIRDRSPSVSEPTSSPLSETTSSQFNSYEQDPQDSPHQPSSPSTHRAAAPKSQPIQPQTRQHSPDEPAPSQVVPSGPKPNPPRPPQASRKRRKKYPLARKGIARCFDCNRRKVGCNRGLPCDACKANGRLCRYPIDPKCSGFQGVGEKYVPCAKCKNAGKECQYDSGVLASGASHPLVGADVERKEGRGGG